MNVYHVDCFKFSLKDELEDKVFGNFYNLLDGYSHSAEEFDDNNTDKQIGYWMFVNTPTIYRDFLNWKISH